MVPPTPVSDGLLNVDVYRNAPSTVEPTGTWTVTDPELLVEPNPSDETSTPSPVKLWNAVSEASALCRPGNRRSSPPSSTAIIPLRIISRLAGKSCTARVDHLPKGEQKMHQGK